MQQEGKWSMEDGHGFTKTEIFEVLRLKSIQNELTSLRYDF